MMSYKMKHDVIYNEARWGDIMTLTRNLPNIDH